MRFHEIRLILIDLSGTIHIGKKPIPGAIEALQKLTGFCKENQLVYRFVSNTTKESRKQLVSNLNSIGFDSICMEQVLTPLYAANETLKGLGKRNPFCFLTDNAQTELDNIPFNNNKEYDSIIVGLDPKSFHYEKLTKAFRILKKGSSIPLIATHQGRYFREEDGELSLGPGPFVRLLEEAGGCKAITVGKPSKSFYYTAVKQAEMELNYQLIPENVVMIGDDVRDDIIGANKIGFQTCLVKTGKFQPEDENVLEKLDGVCLLESFATFVDQLIQFHKKSKI